MSRTKKTIYCLIILILTAFITIPLHYYVQFKSREKMYDKLILQTAERHSLNPALIKALIRRESKFKANIRGAHGEYGLMQVTSMAADDWMRVNRGRKFTNYEQLMQPEINLEVGSWYLALGMRDWKKYKNCTALALAQYNAGPGTVRNKRWFPSDKTGEVLNLVTYPSTKSYIEYIIEYEQYYNEEGVLAND